VNVFPSRQPGTFAIEELDVVLHGQSYKERDVSDNLVHAYPEPVPRRFNIGVLHTGLGGMGGHENYAPCSLEELVNKGYDYWALGHVHQYNLLNERPHVVFPGNLQGRNIRETGPKGAVLITVDDGELSDIEIIQTDVVRWALVSIDTGDTGDTGCCDRIEAIVERAGHAIERAVSSAGGDGRLLVCRLVIKGETELHGSLLASGDRLLAEARSAALGLGDGVAWIEKLVIDTVSPQAPATLFNREDALGQLRLMMARAHEEETLIAQVRADISQFVSKLPHEIRTGTEDPILSAAIKEDDNRLFEGAADYLTARLIEEEQ
jgi:DNA repair protein SbcD/Mre11